MVRSDRGGQPRAARRFETAVAARPRPLGPSIRAFTRIELLAVSAALLLVALVMAPAAISHRSDSERQVCFNNLRLIGRGVMTWAADHTQQFPWRTPVADGGLFPDSGLRPGNAWFEYFTLSNELVTPKILACPADTGVLRAREFYGEFITPIFRANSVSYPLSLDGSMDLPRSWLSSDRNLRADSVGGGCSARVNQSWVIYTLFGGSSLAWTNAVHGLNGHVLTTDGSVEFTSTTRLREIILSPGVDDNGQVHYLKGR